MKKYIVFFACLFSITTHASGFLNNDNNRRIENCRSELRRFLDGVVPENASTYGKSAGKRCHLRYYLQVEHHDGKDLNNGFTLLVYIDGNPYFSNMEVGKDRDGGYNSGISTTMHSCSFSSRTGRIETDYTEPSYGTSPQLAVLNKDAFGRLNVRVKTRFGDQTCYFVE